MKDESPIVFPQGTQQWGGVTVRDLHDVFCPITFNDFVNAFIQPGTHSHQDILAAYAATRTAYADAMIAARNIEPKE